MGQCQYRVQALEANGVVAVNATSLEPYPIFDNGVSGSYGGFQEDEHFVLQDSIIRFQCIDSDDIIFDLDTNQPVIIPPQEDGDEDFGVYSNYVIHTCTEVEEINDEFKYFCIHAPSSSPTQIPSTTPSLTPTISSPPSTTPSYSPSISPSQMPSMTPSTNPTMSAVPSIAPSTSPTTSIQPSKSPSLVPTTSNQPSTMPSTQPSLQPTKQSEQNNDLIDELRQDINNLVITTNQDKTEIMTSITALNQRLDNIENLLTDLQTKQTSTQTELSDFRYYMYQKLRDVQYWVGRCWYYNTQQGIDWNRRWT